MNKLSVVFLCAILTISFALMGCNRGPRPNPDYRIVTGTVTLNGSPIEKVSITFIPADGQGEAATGLSDAQGKYLLTATESLVGEAGTKPGKYKVLARKNESQADPDEEALNAGRITPAEYAELQAKRGMVRTQKSKNLIPAIYGDRMKTPLEVVIEDVKENVIDLKLEDK